MAAVALVAAAFTAVAVAAALEVMVVLGVASGVPGALGQAGAWGSGDHLLLRGRLRPYSWVQEDHFYSFLCCCMSSCTLLLAQSITPPQVAIGNLTHGAEAV